MRLLCVPIEYGYALHFAVVAWTGGDTPAPGKLTPFYRNILESLRCQLYREQWADYVAYWHDAPGPDVRQTFWNRATHDAWRTLFPC